MNRSNDSAIVPFTGDQTAVRTGAGFDPQRRRLIDELVQQNILTPEQVKVVLGENSGDFIIGNYLLLEKIGQGGMGIVYKARHTVMDRIVAIKLLSPDFVKNQKVAARFLKEIRTLAKLEHPNIASALDANEFRQMQYLVMEYVDGTDLGSLVRQKGKLSVDLAIRCIYYTACALAHAHQLGVIHRDIKPGNLLLSKSGQLKVVDFGLARFWENSDAPGQETVGMEFTREKAITGTIDYMSPEQAINATRADERSDIYSLGCTLYFLLTGESVYSGSTQLEKILAHRESKIPLMRTKVPEIPEELDRIFYQMIRKRPAKRFQNWQQLIQTIEQFAISHNYALEKASATESSTMTSQPNRSMSSTRSGVKEQSLKSPSASNTYNISSSESATVATMNADVEKPIRPSIFHGPTVAKLSGLIGITISAGAYIYITTRPAKLPVRELSDEVSAPKTTVISASPDDVDPKSSNIREVDKSHSSFNLKLD